MADFFETGSTDWLTGTIDTFTPRENVASPITDSVRRVDKNWVNPLAQAIIDIQGYLQPPTHATGAMWYFDAGNTTMKVDTAADGMVFIESPPENNTRKALRVGEIEVGDRTQLQPSSGIVREIRFPTDKTASSETERAFVGIGSSVGENPNAPGTWNPLLVYGYEVRDHISGAGSNTAQFESHWHTGSEFVFEWNANMVSTIGQGLRWMHIQKNKQDFTASGATGFLRMDDLSLELDDSMSGGGAVCYRHFRRNNDTNCQFGGSGITAIGDYRVNIFEDPNTLQALRLLDFAQDWQVQFIHSGTGLLLNIENAGSKTKFDIRSNEMSLMYGGTQDSNPLHFQELPAAQNRIIKWSTSAAPKGSIIVQGGDLETVLFSDPTIAVTPLAVNVKDNRISLGTGAFQQFFLVRETETLTASPADGFAANVRLDPGYSAETAEVVTRHNYIDYQDVSVAGSGPAAVTDACVGRFDAAAGTHKAVDGATTKTSPGSVDAWIKWNLNGTIIYLPGYLSKTS